jgi:glucose/arabinose dehydrogenase/plastocyanin
MPRWKPLALFFAVAGLALAGAAVTSAAPPAQVGPDPALIKVKLEAFVQGLENPVVLTAPDDDSGRMFVVEKAGRIRIIKNGTVTGGNFLDIVERVQSVENERGLLGLAFHPNYKQNGIFVVGYTAKSPTGQITYSTFKVSANPDRADAQSEKKLLTWAHNRGNHNGGNVVFGPDGFVYLGTGDGGGSGDPDRNGQKTSVFLGKMLRIDIDNGDPYAVPTDNPFVDDTDSKPEIWAYGLRNPWRYSFDRETGDLYIGDVGQNQVEEVDFQPHASTGGENYGWNVMEGTRCYGATDCDKTGKVLPVAEYSHSEGCSITGGYVYRGSQFPGLDGLYVYADYCTNTIWGLSRDTAGAWRSAEIGSQPNMGIQSFGEGPDGEIYVLGGNGRIMHLTQSAAQDTATPATIAPTPSPTQTITHPETPTATPSGRRVDIKAADYSFAPNTVAAAAGEDLYIVLENIGQRLHDIVFELDGGRVVSSTRITTGQTSSVGFLAPQQPNTYIFYCSVGNHRAMGMEGTLVVGGEPQVSPTPTTATTAVPTIATTAVPTTPTTPTATPSGRRVDVKAADFTFTPSTITAAEGEDLNFVLENVGQRLHDIVFELDGGRVETSDRVMAGQTTSIDFLAPTTAGRYVYFCSVGNHRAQGMVGTLVVGNPPAAGCNPDCKVYLPRADMP